MARTAPNRHVELLEVRRPRVRANGPAPVPMLPDSSHARGILARRQLVFARKYDLIRLPPLCRANGTGGSNPPLSASESQERRVTTRPVRPGFRVFQASSGASRGQTRPQETDQDGRRRTERHPVPRRASTAARVAQGVFCATTKYSEVLWTNSSISMVAKPAASMDSRNSPAVQRHT